MKSGLFFVPALYFIGNFYLYTWAIRLTEPSAKLRKGLLLSIIFFLTLFPVTKIWGRHDFNSFNQLLTLFSSMWMGLSFLLILLAAGSDCFRFLYGRVRFPAAIPLQRGDMPLPDSARLESRRGLMEKEESGEGVSREISLSRRRLLAMGVMMGGAALGGYAFREAREIETTRIELPLRKLPAHFDGISVVQISDVHYGMVHENGRLSNIVGQVNDLRPDLVVITGDLVDEAVSHMEEMAAPLSHLKSRLGVFAVTGNHEFFAGVDRAEAIMKRAGVRVLRNEVEVLPGGLQVLGVDDPIYYRRAGLPLPDIDGLINRLDPEKPSILLYHPPTHFDEAAASGVGLQLSGHTHGPQFFPMIPITWLLYPRFRGLYQEEESFLYVSRGVGTGGPPMRLGSPPELVHIRLRWPKA